MASYVTLIANLARIATSASDNSVEFQTYDSTTAVWNTQWTLDTATGAITLAETQAVSGDQTVGGTLTAGGVNPSNAVASIAGTTAGTIYWVMPFQGSGYKKAIVYLDAYENDTATAQTITYPTEFVQVPNITNPGAVPGVSTTATTLSIDPDTTDAYTAWIIVEGY